MTVTYTAEVATCTGFGCFLKLLFRWVFWFFFWKIVVLYSVYSQGMCDIRLSSKLDRATVCALSMLSSRVWHVSRKVFVGGVRLCSMHPWTMRLIIVRSIWITKCDSFTSVCIGGFDGIESATKWNENTLIVSDTHSRNANVQIDDDNM